MSYTLTLPEDLYRALAHYAEQQRQTPEEALAALLESVCATNGNAPTVTAPEDQTASNGARRPTSISTRGRGSTESLSQSILISSSVTISTSVSPHWRRMKMMTPLRNAVFVDTSGLG